VAVTHRAIARLVRDTNYVTLGPGERTGHISNISFDAATYEIWGALLTGAAVVVIPREVVLSPPDFAGRLRETGSPRCSSPRLSSPAWRVKSRTSSRR